MPLCAFMSCLCRFFDGSGSNLRPRTCIMLANAANTCFSVSPSLTNVIRDCLYLYLMARLTDCSVQFSDLIWRWSWGPGRVCSPVRCWVKSVVKLHRGHRQSPLYVTPHYRVGPILTRSPTISYTICTMLHYVTMSRCRDMANSSMSV